MKKEKKQKHTESERAKKTTTDALCVFVRLLIIHGLLPFK